MLRISYKDRRTNKSILDELNTKLEIVDIINTRKLRYFGHTIRNKNCSLMKTVIQGSIEGKRKRGRPSISYMDNIRKKTEQTTASLYKSASDRQQWREIVKTSTSSATVTNDDADR